MSKYEYKGVDKVLRDKAETSVLESIARAYNVDFNAIIKEKEEEQLKKKNPKEMYLIAGGYAQGLFGIKQDMKKALFWLEEASKAGSMEATCDLASMYMNDQVEGDRQENYAKAYRLYRKAARHKISVAMGNLGECYYQGLGVERDYDEAFKWYKKAAERGDKHAYYCLGRCYLDGNGAPLNYRTGMRYMRKAYDLGIGRAAFQIANAYLTGFGVDIDTEKAIEWYRKAAAMDEPRAFFVLGKFYLDGKGVEKDEKKGWSLIEKAAYGNLDGDIPEARKLLEERDAKKKSEEENAN